MSLYKLSTDLDTLIGALAKRPEVKGLTAVSNNAGSGMNGLGAYLWSIGSHVDILTLAMQVVYYTLGRSTK